MIAHHGIENSQHLAHAGGDGDFLQLAAFHKLFILRFEDRVVADASESGHVKSSPNSGSAVTEPMDLAVRNSFSCAWRFV